MPTYLVTDPQTGVKLKLTGDSPPTVQELEQIFAGQNNAATQKPLSETTDLPQGEGLGGATAQPTRPPDTFGEDVLDVAGELAAGANRAAMFIPDTLTKAANLIPGVDLPTPSEAIGGATGFTPGEGGFMDPGMAREAVGAAGEVLIPGAAAAKVVQGRNLASLPGAVAEFAGIGSAPTTTAGRTVAQVAEGITDPTAGLPKKELLRRQVQQGDAQGAGFMLQDGKPVKDLIARRAMDQGFDDSVVAMVKQATPEEKSLMRQMTNIRRKASDNLRFGAQNRATDIVGDRVMDRVKHVQQVNREAGKAVNQASKTLDNKAFDWTGFQQNLSDGLDELGVTITQTDKGKPKLNFEGSTIQGLGPQNAIKKLFNRLDSNTNFSAKGAHDVKKFIDELVDFGKTAKGGISGKTEGILKGLRKQVSDQLNESFDDYGNANRVFSATREAMDDFQKAIGPRVNLQSQQANKSTGQVLRGLLSNNKTRVELSDSLQNLESVANDPSIRINLADRIEDLSKKGGRRFDDDLLTLISFSDELDAVFGPSARTSLAGESAKAIREGARATTDGGAGVLVDKLAEGVEKARGINKQNAFKAINELLSR